jgi:2,3-bisphosphoglycerate-independent phosphoglycerate mutase
MQHATHDPDRDPIAALQVSNDRRILLLVMDGLGGLPRAPGGPTELEAARTPHLDALARDAECGLHLPVDYGIAPGSAPGHLALFGYDPLQYPIGRGIVAALGIGFSVQSGDVAVRLNFATRDSSGAVTDRRAGRIATELCTELAARLDGIVLPGVEVAVRPVRDYRAVVVLRGAGLSEAVADTDPQATGVPAHEPRATVPEAEHTAAVTAAFVTRARELLAAAAPANEVLLRGFAQLPAIPSLQQRFGLRPVALAVYPDYKGVSRLVGMEVIDDLTDLAAQGRALATAWPDHDYFFLHHKYTDSTGEDGDFDAKVAEIEKVDAFLPELLACRPDVVIVTGDHSTPSVARSHTAHPVPFLIHAAGARPDAVREFGERACAGGAWGVVPGRALLAIALGHAGKVARYGA